MKKIFSFLLFIACLFNISILSAQTDTPNKTTVMQLDRFRADYITAMLNGKSALIEKSYDPNIRMMPAFQKTIIGKANTALYHNAFFMRFNILSYTRNEIEILDLGTQVIETGTSNVKLKIISTGEQYELAGKYLDIWKESRDGTLSLITEAWNYDQYYGNVHEHLKFDEVPSVVAAHLPNVPIDNNLAFELNAYCRLLDATVTNHDADVWTWFYSDDSVLMGNYYPALKGKQEIDAYNKMHVKELPVFEGLDIRNDKIDDLGKYVVEYSSHIASWKNGNSSGVSLGKNIRIWRREPDHSLKIFRSIAMYDY